jgi:acyl-homoserine lactone synthase
MAMIHIVTPENEHHYHDEMEQAFRLRYRVFVEERGWRALAKPDGREIDQFDNEHAVHMLYIEHGMVLGYQRMLPTTRPHLLSEVMPELCEGEHPVGAHIWEWTRFCVERERREKGRAVCPITNMLLAAAVEWGMECGISKLIIETNPTWLLRMIQPSFSSDAIGPAAHDAGTGHHRGHNLIRFAHTRAVAGNGRNQEKRHRRHDLSPSRFTACAIATEVILAHPLE